jgi:hypothetical protein
LWEVRLAPEREAGGPSPRLTLPAARAAAQRLVERELERPGAFDTDAARLGAALFRAYAAVCDNVRATMGDDGCIALFGRAYARELASHPALHEVRGRTKYETSLENVLAGIDAHGAAAVRAAVEAVIATVIDILARLIGEDMAIRIIDHDAAPPADGGTARPAS